MNATNRDGNTPLVGAAFMCHSEVVRLLLEQGASTKHRNSRDETIIEIMSRPWTEDLVGFYTGLGNLTGVTVNLDRLQEERPKIAELLHAHESR